jgi:hypothetical protein
MPDVDGLELLRYVRSDDKLRDLPVISEWRWKGAAAPPRPRVHGGRCTATRRPRGATHGQRPTAACTAALAGVQCAMHAAHSPPVQVQAACGAGDPAHPPCRPCGWVRSDECQRAPRRGV